MLIVCWKGFAESKSNVYTGLTKLLEGERRIHHEHTTGRIEQRRLTQNPAESLVKPNGWHQHVYRTNMEYHIILLKQVCTHQLLFFLHSSYVYTTTDVDDVVFLDRLPSLPLNILIAHQCCFCVWMCFCVNNSYCLCLSRHAPPITTRTEVPPPQSHPVLLSKPRPVNSRHKRARRGRGTNHNIKTQLNVDSNRPYNQAI